MSHPRPAERLEVAAPGRAGRRPGHHPRRGAGPRASKLPWSSAAPPTSRPPRHRRPRLRDPPAAGPDGGRLHRRRGRPGHRPRRFGSAQLRGDEPRRGFNPVDAAATSPCAGCHHARGERCSALRRASAPTSSATWPRARASRRPSLSRRRLKLSARLLDDALLGLARRRARSGRRLRLDLLGIRALRHVLGPSPRWRVQRLHRFGDFAESPRPSAPTGAMVGDRSTTTPATRTAALPEFICTLSVGRR